MNLLQPNHLCREPRPGHTRLAMLSATSALRQPNPFAPRVRM